MTIDEAIRHAEEVAEDNEAAINWQGITETMKKRCAECAADHRQLAEWLKELKEHRTADVQPVVYCKDCKYAQNPNDTMVYCTYFECGTMSQNDFCSQGEEG